MAAADPWLAAEPDQPPARLRVPSALLPVAGPHALSRGGAAASPHGRERPPQRVSLRRRAARPHLEARRTRRRRRQRMIDERTEAAESLGPRAGTGQEILRAAGLLRHFPINACLLNRTGGHIHAVR